MPDSRIVTRRIAATVWPELSELGFEVTGRTAWRQSRHKIDIVKFMALGSYTAGVYATTPYSFKVQLGIWLTYAVPSYVGEQPDRRPDEAACPLRRSLLPPSALRRGHDRAVWHVDDDANSVDSTVALAARAVHDEGLAWFERFDDPLEILRTFEQEDEDMEGTWGFGKMGSPARKDLLADTRRHLASAAS